jgi:hypothetical protein
MPNSQLRLWRKLRGLAGTWAISASRVMVDSTEAARSTVVVEQAAVDRRDAVADHTADQDRSKGGRPPAFDPQIYKQRHGSSRRCTSPLETTDPGKRR